MSRIYSKMSLGKLLALVMVTVWLAGCAAVPKVNQCNPLTLPKAPPSVVTDNGKIDKSKYPNTVFVKPPVVDNAKGRASWSFEDVDKINKNLTLWPLWHKDVKELIEGHNKVVSGEGKKEKGGWFSR